MCVGSGRASLRGFRNTTHCELGVFMEWSETENKNQNKQPVVWQQRFSIQAIQSEIEFWKAS
jgi:hypothetical protein